MIFEKKLIMNTFFLNRKKNNGKIVEKNCIIEKKYENISRQVLFPYFPCMQNVSSFIPTFYYTKHLTVPVCMDNRGCSAVK